jgi:UDP-glucose 4-epimerase
MNKKVIVTGGCGYIGSHTLVDLIENGFDVVSIDNNSRSSSDILKGVKKITGVNVKNYSIDLKNKANTLKVFEENKDASGIIHFAAYKTVPESVKNPLFYYENNIQSLCNVLEAAKFNQINHFVFSSSCSVYGNTKELPVRETTPLGLAESPYAATKQMGERIVEDFSKATGISSILLRYFNPVGAHPSAHIGEMPIGTPDNLVPYITQTAIGKREKLTVFGGDYDTRDGSCIRDYIHVMDIANAHIKAIQYLLGKNKSTNCDIFNLGTGVGVTVLEAIKAFEEVSGLKLNYKIGERRAGDVVAVYADNQKASKELGWLSKYTLRDMMATAWEWEKRLLKINGKS